MTVLILGAGGHGRVVLDILRTAGKHKPDRHSSTPTNRSRARLVDGLPVLGPATQLARLKPKIVKAAIVAIGDNRTRLAHLKMVREAGLKLINAIHPRANVSETASLGHGIVIAAGASIGTGASLGDGAIVNTNAVVDHECAVGAACHIAPGAILAGRVTLGEAAFVGIGANVLPCLTIGEDAVVGAGALVRVDVAVGETVVGVPARRLRSR